MSRVVNNIELSVDKSASFPKTESSSSDHDHEWIEKDNNRSSGQVIPSKGTKREVQKDKNQPKSSNLPTPKTDNESHIVPKGTKLYKPRLKVKNN